MNDGRTSRSSGFTLIEAVMVIAITGILGAMVAVFLRTPVEGYFDAVRRAELTDAADTALRRMARDLRTALPNSLRSDSTGSDQCIEFLPVAAGGRYRVENGSGAGPFDRLDFAASDTSFDVLGQVGLPQPAGTQLVIHNLGIPGADAYGGDNRAQIASATASKVTLAAGKIFPLESPGRRFQVVQAASVVFACIGTGLSAGGDGTGVLVRSTRAISATRMASCPSAPPAGAAVLAENVRACTLSYTPALTQRAGLLSMSLQLARSSEAAGLQMEVHVDNLP